jgi:TonB family protein
MAHLARGDWTVQILAELLRSVFWFNPILWLACRRLRQESEYACDDAVLSLGVQRTDYAAELVELARAFNHHGRAWLPAPAIARSSTLRKRIHAMLNVHRNRRPLTGFTRWASFAVIAAITLPIAAFSGQPFGTLSGSVVDPFGGLVPNVTLTLSHVGSTAKHEVRSDQTGAFQFVGLRPGDYRLEARLSGFADLSQPLTVAAGQTLYQNVSLRVGSVQETISVVGGPSEAPRSAGPAARADSVQAAPCTPSPVGGRILPPKKVKDVRPRYPEGLLDTGTEKVVLTALISTDGSVRDLQTVSAANPDVESAAVAAVSQWLFTPTLLNCVPIDVKMNVTVTFRPGQ